MKNSLISAQKHQIQTLLADGQSVGVVLSDKQNLDSMAAALSLYLALVDSGKNVQIVSKKDPIVEHSNLVGVDKIKRNFDGQTKMLVVSIPYREGEVEKVSFTTEGDRMNFNIVAGDAGITPFSEKDIKILGRGSAPSVVFTIGIERSEDIRDMVDVSTGVKVINVDISPANAQYGDVVVVNKDFSSLSEVVAALIEELGFPLDVDTAQNLMDGIISATNNFSSPSTSPYAFESAGLLLRFGARRGSEKTFAQPQEVQELQPSFSPAPSQKREERVEPKVSVPPVQVQEDKVQEDNFSEEDDVPSDWFVPKVFSSKKSDPQ